MLRFRSLSLLSTRTPNRWEKKLQENRNGNNETADQPQGHQSRSVITSNLTVKSPQLMPSSFNVCRWELRLKAHQKRLRALQSDEAPGLPEHRSEESLVSIDGSESAGNFKGSLSSSSPEIRARIREKRASAELDSSPTDPAPVQPSPKGGFLSNLLRKKDGSSRGSHRKRRNTISNSPLSHSGTLGRRPPADIGNEEKQNYRQSLSVLEMTGINERLRAEPVYSPSDEMEAVVGKSKQQKRRSRRIQSSAYEKAYIEEMMRRELGTDNESSDLATATTTRTFTRSFLAHFHKRSNSNNVIRGTKEKECVSGENKAPTSLDQTTTAMSPEQPMDVQTAVGVAPAKQKLFGNKCTPSPLPAFLFFPHLDVCNRQWLSMDFHSLQIKSDELGMSEPARQTLLHSWRKNSKGKENKGKEKRDDKKRTVKLRPKSTEFPSKDLADLLDRGDSGEASPVDEMGKSELANKGPESLNRASSTKKKRSISKDIILQQPSETESKVKRVRRLSLMTLHRGKDWHQQVTPLFNDESDPPETSSNASKPTRPKKKAGSAICLASLSSSSASGKQSVL